MKLPGPDHPITIAPLGRHVAVRFAGAVIGASDEALSLKAENVAWSYEAPFPAMAEIRDCLAFYPGKVEIVS